MMSISSGLVDIRFRPTPFRAILRLLGHPRGPLYACLLRPALRLHWYQILAFGFSQMARCQPCTFNFGDDGWVKPARISAIKEGARLKKPLRAQVSIEPLVVLRQALDLSKAIQAAVWAIATCAFFSFRRLRATPVDA